MSTAPVTLTAAQRLATTESSPISTQEEPTQPRLGSIETFLSERVHRAGTWQVPCAREDSDKEASVAQEQGCVAILYVSASQ